MNAWQRKLIILSSFIAVAGAVIHVGALIAGPRWVKFLQAPRSVVESARDGTWLAPVGVAIITCLMLICAVYALSAVGLVRKMPFQRTIIAGMAAVTIARNLFLVPAQMMNYFYFNTFNVTASIVWGLASAGFVVAFFAAAHQASEPSKTTGV